MAYLRLRSLLLLLAATLACAAGAAPASAKVTLGPDVTTPAPSGGFNLGGLGCQGGSYSPCLYLNFGSSNPAIKVASPITGVITKWRFRGGCCTEPQTQTKTLTLVTATAGTVPGYPSAVVDLTGSSYELRPGDQLLSSSPPELPARLPIKAGQWFGIIADEPIALSADATLGGVLSSVMMNGVTYQGQRYGSATNAALMLSVDVEPDADGDGYGDETQDCNPADPATHDVGCAPVVSVPGPSVNPLSVGITCPAGTSCTAPAGSGPAPTPTPAPAPPIALVRIVGSVPASSDGTRFNVSLGCPSSAAGPCTGVLVLNPDGGSRARLLAATAAAKAKSYGTVRYSIAPGKTAKLVVRLSAAGRKALKKKGKLKVKVTLQPTGGAATSVSRTLRLKAHGR